MSDDLTGVTLDERYRVEAVIGGGGMGVVYRARHLLLDQPVAIKVLGEGAALQADAGRRFVREARSTFRFDHPHCVRVIDLGATPDGLPYLVMDYLDGRTVGQDLAVDGPLESRRVAHIGVQACGALAHAHGLGLIHRDLKPDNLMLINRGGDPDYVKVLDFGLAKMYDADGPLATAMSLTPLTRQGAVFGTPEYMSPEQATGRPLDPASDVYSLGVCLFEALTGQIPFQGATFTETLAMHVREQPVSPAARRPDLDIDSRLSEIVLACLSKKPEQRPRPAELERDLTALSVPGPAPARPASAVAASETVDLSTARVRASAGEPEPAPRAQQPTIALEKPADPPARRSRIAVWITAAVVGGAAVAGGLLAAIGPGGAEPAIDGGPALSATPPGDGAPSAPDPGPDAGSPPDGGGIPADSSVQSTPDSDRAPPPATNPEALAHLQAAEKARRQGNHLRQLAEAHKALKLLPNSRKAAYLVGDALIASGDRERGCTYLRQASRTRFREAGCTD